MIDKKVFVCDDNQSIVEIIENVLLDFSDIEVITETDSLHAILNMEQEKPDILLVDLTMPGLPGDQLIKKVRHHNILNHLFIICMSANLDGKEIAIAAGANIFLSKPFDLDELIDAIYGFEAYKEEKGISI